MKLRWSGRPSEHIVAYYGSFIHGDSYNIILEYADQGTLETFMRRTKSPSSAEETLLLWDRLLKVTHGLMTIHGKIGNDSSASQMLNGYVSRSIRHAPLLISTNRIHQDVKPANILVFGGNGTSPYDCYFKIADLGLTHFKPSVPQLDDPSDLDAFGTRAYGMQELQLPHSNPIDMCLGAPETYRAYKDSDSAPLQVTKQVDIWSIGCVLSEVAIWAHYGWRRVEEYRRRRSSEVQIRGGVSGEHHFHWGDGLLDAVSDTHEDILGKNVVKDISTRSVLGGLVVEMLQHGSRPDARLVFEKSIRLVKECEKRLGVSVDELGGSLKGESVNSNEARTRTTSSPQVPNEHHRSRAERGSSLEEPVPPDDSSTLKPSSLSSSSRSSPQRHYQKSASQSDKRFSNRVERISQPSGQILTVTSDLLPPSGTVKTHEGSSQQHIQQRQEGPVRPTLSIDEGHTWKDRKKTGGVAVLRGGENLTSLDRRDHVSLVLS